MKLAAILATFVSCTGLAYAQNANPMVDALAKHYGFTDEELDFIINYDIKYRMGRGEEEGEVEQ